jgi:hypothetical protein
MNFEKYLYTEENALIDKAKTLAFGEEVMNKVITVKHEMMDYKCSMSEINAMMYMLSILANEKHLCSVTSGNYLQLQIILNGDKIKDFKNETWKVLSSPKISWKKIAHLESNKVADILVWLNQHRELWKQGFNEDASKYFK